MTLVFRLKAPPPQRCNLAPLTPDRLADYAGDVEAIEIQTTKRRLCVGDLFDVVPGDPSDIRFEGGSERFDYLGASMSRGRIVVEGDVGQQAGRRLSGGELMVAGSAGRLAGSGMRGGRLSIAGDAGDLAGGPLPGEMIGMSGGVLHVGGAAGERAGDRLRRGLIVIEGSAGMGLASRMIGGTVLCRGPAGPRAGTLMRRGTLILGSGGEAGLGPTFVDTGSHDLVVLRLVAGWLKAEGLEPPPLAGHLRRWVGDTAVIGKGEVFLLPAA
jgi:formylmethanofuran dehydrogenase subunit C